MNIIEIVVGVSVIGGTIVLCEFFLRKKNKPLVSAPQPNVAIDYFTHEEAIGAQEPQTAADAIRQTEATIATVKSETRKRRQQWIYKLSLNETEEEVAKYFGLEGRPTRVGITSMGRRMIAVWNGTDFQDGKEVPTEPNVEPEF